MDSKTDGHVMSDETVMDQIVRFFYLLSRSIYI